MDKPYATAWAVVGDDTSKSLNIVYNVLAPSREGAYLAAGRKLGDPPYTTQQMRKAGWTAKRVRITLEE